MLATNTRSFYKKYPVSSFENWWRIADFKSTHVHRLNSLVLRLTPLVLHPKNPLSIIKINTPRYYPNLKILDLMAGGKVIDHQASATCEISGIGGEEHSLPGFHGVKETVDNRCSGKFD